LQEPFYFRPKLVQNTNQNLISAGKNTLTHPICSVTSTGWNGCNLDP